MKTIQSICFLLLIAQSAFSNSSFCPDPPANDSPCINDSNPPLDLTVTGTHEGMTCCATLDIENVDCSTIADGASVWYTYTPGIADGFDINIEAADAVGPMTLEVYKGTADAGCTGELEFIGSRCNITNNSIKLGNCFASDEVIFVKVSTSELEEDCGDFTITIASASCGETADDCIDLMNFVPILPITNPELALDYFCVDGCLDYACPEEDSNGGCMGFTIMPTVWFQVTVDDLASQMFTYVTPNGNWEPIWAVYTGPDCDNLTSVNVEGYSPCSNDDNTPNLHQIALSEEEVNYWISVTADPESLPSTGLVDGSFELCISTTIDSTLCLGEFDGGAYDDEFLLIEVIEREVEGLPLDGPFIAGEEVTINITYLYDASDKGVDWLMGFVPVFGSGWDMTTFDFDENGPFGNGTMALWYEEGEACAPILQEPNPILCTYTNEDGNLEICNQLDSPCPDCPKSFMEEGDLMPSGYFWVTDGTPEGCNNDCSPGEGWGIGSASTQIEWTFTLTVKKSDDLEDCYLNNDLSIGLQTFSDGAAGCWEDPSGECLLARLIPSKAWKVECEYSAVLGSDQEICHDGITDILLQTEDGSTNTIIVEVEDNPNVEGEMNQMFVGGIGTIQDNLSNLTNEPQVVVYTAYTEDPNLPDTGLISEIEVIVYPEMKATFPPVFVCEGSCVDITPVIEGGFGGQYNYLWSTGENTVSIDVCPVVATTYFVTVEDGLGCMAIAEVQVDTKPNPELLLPESIDVFKDDNFDFFDPDYFICLDFISGSEPFGVTWNSPVGIVGLPYGIDSECFAINEESSIADNGNNGQYFLMASVTDIFGCESMVTTIVNVFPDSTLIGLEEELLDKVNISPNPSNDAFHISLDKEREIKYTIRDVVGRVVDKGVITSGNKTLHLGSEPNGLYLLGFTHPELKQVSFYKLLKI